MSELKQSKKNIGLGLVGRKIGMTTFFVDDSRAVPVTVIEAGPCYVVGLKSAEKAGYCAVQVGFGQRKQQRVNKAERHQFKAAERGCPSVVREFRVTEGDLSGYELGSQVAISKLFEVGQEVDVSGTSIGRGFVGVIRKGAKGQPMTRGTHEYRRHIGAIGCRKFPGRVFKNKKMPGHLGNERVTVQNLKVVAVDNEAGLIMVRGAVPGSRGGSVEVVTAKKRRLSN